MDERPLDPCIRDRELVPIRERALGGGDGLFGPTLRTQQPGLLDGEHGRELGPFGAPLGLAELARPRLDLVHQIERIDPQVRILEEHG